MAPFKPKTLELHDPPNRTIVGGHGSAMPLSREPQLVDDRAPIHAKLDARRLTATIPEPDELHGASRSAEDAMLGWLGCDSVVFGPSEHGPEVLRA